MKNILIIVLFLTNFIANKSCSKYITSTPPCAEVTGIIPVMQIDSSLCWGACLEMFIKKNDSTSTFTQCDLSCKPCNTCCMTVKCDSIAPIEPIGLKNKLQKLGYDSGVDMSPQFDSITAIICKNQPVFTKVDRIFKNNKKNGHWILIIGYFIDSKNVNHIKYIDPWTASCKGCIATTTFDNTLFDIRAILVNVKKIPKRP